VRTACLEDECLKESIVLAEYFAEEVAARLSAATLIEFVDAEEVTPQLMAN
jgi:hypothetical protein